MKKKFLITNLLLCCFAVCLAVIADMNGQWTAMFDAPDGNAYPLTYTFKIDGGTLTGTMETSGLSVPIDSGKVSGENVSFSFNVEGTSYSHKGKYYTAADSIGMDVSFQGNKQHITLTRPK